MGVYVRGRFRDKGALFGGGILLIVLLVVAFANVIAPYGPDAQNAASIAESPGLHHLLGTDSLGRDVLSRLLFGARATMSASFLAVAISIVIGVPLGLLAGYRRRLTETAIMRFTDVWLSFPSFLLAVVVVAVLGANLENAAISVGVSGAPQFIRLVRGDVLVVRGREYVVAAVGSGLSGARVAVRYVLPNVARSILVFSTLSLASAILGIAGLSFLGLGQQPPAAEWGLMVQSGFNYLTTAPVMVLAPGAAIALVVLAVNLVGDAVDGEADRKAKEPVSVGRARR